MTGCYCAVKDPDSRTLFGFDWGDWRSAGDTITSTEWILDEGIINDGDSLDPTQLITSIWLTGGTVGQTYMVCNRTTWASGGIEDRTMEITCAEK